MSRWSLVDTRRLVEACFGRSHAEIVAPCLHALAERQEYARYHYCEIQRLLNEFCGRHLATKPLLVVAHGADEVARGDFEWFMTEVGAHAHACVLSIHSIADVMAFAVYHALGCTLQPGALAERYISAKTVPDRLRATSGDTQIADDIKSLCSNPSYKHVAALANKSKHQALVRPVLNEDWTGSRQERHEVRFSAFVHDGHRYPERELTSLLKPAYEAAATTTIKVGNRLNSLLAAIARLNSGQSNP